MPPKKLELKPKVRPEKPSSGSDTDECDDTVTNVSHEQNNESSCEDNQAEQTQCANDEHVEESLKHTDMPEGERFNGVVKWFNDRRGYGFITVVTPGPHLEEDIFVHQTHIRPLKCNYRTLVQGEYVNFSMGDADAAFNEDGDVVSSHTHQAIFVTGIEGRELLCDHSFRTNSRRSGNNFKGGSNRGSRRPYGRSEDDGSDGEYEAPRRDTRPDNQFNRRRDTTRRDTPRDDTRRENTRDNTYENRPPRSEQPRRENARVNTRSDNRGETRPPRQQQRV
jgi:cold shock CspA family protein